MSDKMREEFHEWCRSIGFTLKMNAWGNDYAIGYGLEQWLAWQASRSALVVELPPEREERFIDSYQEGWNDAIDSCRVRVESVGVTCK